MYSKFAPILFVCLFGFSLQLEMKLLSDWDKEFYQTCSANETLGHKIKCVGYPIGCVMKQTCLWMGAVTDHENELRVYIISHIDVELNFNNLWSSHIHTLNGWTRKPFDESMNKVLCRKMELDDVKFFLLSNDTRLIKKIYTSQEQARNMKLFGTILKTGHLENCSEEIIPMSKNSKNKVNLENILKVKTAGKLWGGSFFPINFDTAKVLADSSGYNVDPTNTLYYTKFQEVVPIQAIN